MNLASALSFLAFLTLSSSSQIPLSQNDVPSLPRIAIIGAGASGSSTAYHLSLSGLPLNITIFESNSYVGGRTTTVNALNDPRYPVELGGSIFVEANKILVQASDEFNLPISTRDSSFSPIDIGIWDGTKFVLSIPTSADGLRGTLGSYWTLAKLFWKYGMSPLRTRNLQQDTIGRFLRIYDEPLFHDLGFVAEKVGLDAFKRRGDVMLSAAGISREFTRDVIQASTRVNYAQNLDEFHGLETMVCMSTQGGRSVEGGNWQIFDEMVRRSGARVVFGAEVQKVDVGESVVLETSNGVEEFDMVVVAAPWNTSRLEVQPRPKVKGAEYVSLHVTLFTSPERLDPGYFGVNADEVPDSVLTTLPEELDGMLGRGVEGVGPSEFWSLSLLKEFQPATDVVRVGNGTIPLENLDMERQFLYKIFSPELMTAETMVDLFGWCEREELSEKLRRHCEGAGGRSSIGELPSNLVTWSYEKLWHSYPYLPPTNDFDCFDVYDCPGHNADERMNDTAGKVWYTNGMERFISTMETSALSGRNVAALIIDRLRSTATE